MRIPRLPGLLGLLGSLACLPACREAREPRAAVSAAEDQPAAIRKAVEVDLPALKEADRAVFEGRGGKKAVVSRADELDRLRALLRPTAVPPGGGVTAVTLTFFRGEEPIRRIWMFDDGEWGFARPGTSWTTGREPGLAQFVLTKLGGQEGPSDGK
jgi:hypothetical protein